MIKNIFSRRDFAATTAYAALGLSILPTPITSGVPNIGKAKHLIYIYMGGGMSHIDSFDPKPDAPTDYAGPIGSIPTNVSGIRLGSYFERLSKHADKFALINSLNQKTGDHSGGQYWMLTGYEKRATITHPELLSWKQRFNPNADNTPMPDSFIIGGGALPGSGFMGPRYSPLPIGDPNAGLPNSKTLVDDSRNDARLKALEVFNSSFVGKYKSDDVRAYNEYYDNTINFLKSDELSVFDLTKESDASRESFGGMSSRAGQSALLAARLIESGVGGVRMNIGGCDNHSTIQTAFQGAAEGLDVALSALLDRLSANGKLAETLIVVGTEFGRTPKINENAGRDHYPRVFSGLMAGGGIVGGQVYGSSDDRGVGIKDNPVSPEDYNATIATALGIPLDTVVFSPSGRPFLVAGHTETANHEIISVGVPIMQLFS